MIGQAKGRSLLVMSSLKVLWAVEEEHGILTYNGRMFSLHHFHFQFKSFNISTILTFKLIMRVYVWKLNSWLSLAIYNSLVESTVNK